MSRAQSGFSVIEMLLVVVVVAVIAALLIPAISRGRAKAEEIRCMQQLRASSQVVMNLIADASVSWKTFAEGTPENNQWARRADSRGLIPDRRVVRCPKGRTTFGVTHVAWAWQTYGLNISDLETGTLENDKKNLREVTYTLYPARMTEPSRHVFLADSASDASGVPLQTFRLYHKVSYRSGIYAWHDGRANVLFFDGHGESIEVAKLGEKGVPYYDQNGDFQIPMAQTP